MVKIGDTVRFLNSKGGGKVVAIEGNIARVEDEDGFEVPVLLKECVTVLTAHQLEATAAAEKAQQEEYATVKPAAAPAPAKPAPIQETDYGEKISLELAFEPENIKQISTTAFLATLVNDSNYFISFTLSTRADDAEQWTLRHADIIEPNFMLALGKYEVGDINSLENIMLQYVAYKIDKPFAAKDATTVKVKMDTTKFCKLHCFRPDDYFDEPVLTVSLVNDDRPYQPVKFSAKEISEAMRTKQQGERELSRPVQRRVPKKDEPLVVDLHINQLLDSTAGMSPADILNYQIDTFRKTMDSNLRRHGMKIVFIHGKGEGVLREAITKELNHRYKGHQYCDASFREYGFGATQVTIH